MVFITGVWIIKLSVRRFLVLKNLPMSSRATGSRNIIAAEWTHMRTQSSAIDALAAVFFNTRLNYEQKIIYIAFHVQFCEKFHKKKP